MRKLSPADRREIWTLIIGGGVALISALLGIVLDLPKLLKGFVGDPTTWAIVITVTLPILITLTANQVAQSIKANNLREQTLADIIKVFPHSSSVIHFDNSSEAMGYLIDAMGRAACVYNTRMTLREVEDSDALNSRLTQAFDVEIGRAIEAGTDYFWLITYEFTKEANAIAAQRNRAAAKSDTVGAYSAYVLPAQQAPFLHFCILDYGVEREVLLGWALTEAGDFREKVFLIRDDRFVDYFRDLFKMLCRSARRV